MKPQSISLVGGPPADGDGRAAEIRAHVLLNHAAKYTERGGQIRLTARREEAEIVIRVQDNGIGIPPEQLPRMFDLFAQGDSSLARAEGGLGIGLTLVQKLAEMHGGIVQARSQGPGTSSEFFVRLPAAVPGHAGQPRGAAEPAPPGNPLTCERRADRARGGSMRLSIAVLALSSIAMANPTPRPPDAAESAQATKRLKVVIFGGHPDDPESGAGGLTAMLTRQGHEVILAYGTTFRGGRRFFDRPEAEVRQEEAASACKVLGATPRFFPYAHEKLVADEATSRAIAAWLDEVKPDIVVTHWPLDTHPNHHVVSSLVWQSYRRQGGWNLYFFEVMTDQQTLAFRPELYLDIGPVREIKKQALDRHKSQKPEAIWEDHERMHRRRGVECGVEFAEAYSLVEPKPGCPLLPVTFLRKRP
ncbi:MAG: PIG-L family deacetylase [Isosphaeraceae bacterium]